MKIISWNVNSLKARFHLFTKLVEEESPDVILLQEIKVTNDQFPYLEIEELGYTSAVFGQKTYNGVAILAKGNLEEVKTPFILPDDQDLVYDDLMDLGRVWSVSFPHHQARYVEAFFSGFKIASIYVPNGQELYSNQYNFKLYFLNKLKKFLKKSLEEDDTPFIIAGDFNIAPSQKDVYDPNLLDQTVLYSVDQQKIFRELLNVGFVDVAAGLNSQEYTWWDYRAGKFPRNHGMRIDHFLASFNAFDLIKEIKVLKEYRGMEKPSDHAPVLINC